MPLVKLRFLFANYDRVETTQEYDLETTTVDTIRSELFEKIPELNLPEEEKVEKSTTPKENRKRRHKFVVTIDLTLLESELDFCIEYRHNQPKHLTVPKILELGENGVFY